MCRWRDMAWWYFVRIAADLEGNKDLQVGFQLRRRSSSNCYDLKADIKRRGQEVVATMQRRYVGKVDRIALDIYSSCSL